MFLQSLKITSSGVLQGFILGAVGYFLMKKGVLGKEGNSTISRLVVQVTLPALIFSSLVRDFSFAAYPNWWVFPLLSFGVTVFGLLAGLVFTWFIRSEQKRWQFLSLTAFQNSGYLPLVLFAAILPKEQADVMFIYVFLFLMGFNLLVWSLGVFMVSFRRGQKFELGSLFSPPVVTTIFSLVFIFLGLNRFVPDTLIRPLKMIGDCTLPLAMFVVGGNLAVINFDRVDKREMALLVLAKLVIMPLIGLALISKFNLPALIGLLILVELAVPSATSLSVIVTHYKKEDLLISQGVFWGHILALLTLPVFLSIYFIKFMVKL